MRQTRASEGRATRPIYIAQDPEPSQLYRQCATSSLIIGNSRHGNDDYDEERTKEND